MLVIGNPKRCGDGLLDMARDQFDADLVCLHQFDAMERSGVFG
jgi:hypothetical protein